MSDDDTIGCFIGTSTIGGGVLGAIGGVHIVEQIYDPNNAPWVVDGLGLVVGAAVGLVSGLAFSYASFLALATVYSISAGTLRLTAAGLNSPFDYLRKNQDVNGLVEGWERQDRFDRIDKNLESVLSEEDYRGLCNSGGRYLLSTHYGEFRILRLEYDTFDVISNPLGELKGKKKAAERLANEFGVKLGYNFKTERVFRRSLDSGTEEDLVRASLQVISAELLLKDYLAGRRGLEVSEHEIESTERPLRLYGT
tara:strand:+ start:90 stop:848 length:759 start_codon:yes stop_codon:yes gene_type:complete